MAASITSAIAGTGGVTYSGVAASRLVLAGRNTYAGTTTVDMGSGVVRVAVASEGAVGGVTAGAFGTGRLTLASGRGAGSDAATTRTILNPISVTGNVSLGEAFASAPLVFAAAAGATLALGVGGPGSWVASNVDQLFFTGTGAGTLARVDMEPKANVGIDTTAGSFRYTSSPASQRGLVKLGDNTLWLTGTCTYSGRHADRGGHARTRRRQRVGLDPWQCGDERYVGDRCRQCRLQRQVRHMYAG